MRCFNLANVSQTCHHEPGGALVPSNCYIVRHLLTSSPAPGRPMTHLLLALLLLSPGSTGSPEDLPPGLSPLVSAEREFAATCGREGIRASFMKYFADDGISLAPVPHNYKKTAASTPPPADPLARTLSWEPILAGASSSGDLGFTMGPSVYRDRSDADAAARYGFYFSVWKKQHDGSWRVAVDVGSGASSAVAKYFGRPLMPV